MDDLQRAISILQDELNLIKRNPCRELVYVQEERKAYEIAISAMRELQQYKERLKQLRHAEVLSFQCKLPDGRICHFSDFLDFLENGQVK